MIKVAVKFSRMGMSRFLSHLDMQRTFSRALRRSGMSVKKSSGFNPHIVTSFASALSVGMETVGDYMEFTLLEQINTELIKDKLNAVLPDGIRITEAYYINDNKKIMALIYAMGIEYRVSEEDKPGFLSAFARFIKNEELIVEKKSKSGVKLVDIMPMIYSADIGETVELKLAHSNDASLNPFFLLEQINKFADKQYRPEVIRTELYAKGLIPLSVKLQ